MTGAALRWRRSNANDCATAQRIGPPTIPGLDFTGRAEPTAAELAPTAQQSHVGGRGKSWGPWSRTRRDELRRRHGSGESVSLPAESGQLQLLEKGERAIDEEIDVRGRATIETVLQMSAEQVAGPKEQGRRDADRELSDGLVDRVAPRLVPETHQREVAARSRHLAPPVGGRGSHAVEQDPLIVAIDRAHVDVQHAGRLDQLQPRQKPLHATDQRARRTGLGAVQRRVRMVVVADGDKRIKPVAHRCRTQPILAAPPQVFTPGIEGLSRAATSRVSQVAHLISVLRPRGLARAAIEGGLLGNGERSTSQAGQLARCGGASASAHVTMTHKGRPQ